VPEAERVDSRFTSIASVAGNAEPDVSMTIRVGLYVLLRCSSASPSCPTKLQQIHPFNNSWTPATGDTPRGAGVADLGLPEVVVGGVACALGVAEAKRRESTATEPNSFLRRQRRVPGGGGSCGRRLRRRVVLPAPRKPVRIVMGMGGEAAMVS